MELVQQFNYMQCSYIITCVFSL